MLYNDTETCGLTGPVVLIQTGIKNKYGELTDVELFYPWEVPVKDTLQYIDGFMTHEKWNLYNCSYDSFHLCKLYNTFSLVDNKNELPDIEEIHGLEQVAWMGNKCIRPHSVIDTFILLKKNLFQFLMTRQNVVISKVHVSIVNQLKIYLEEWSHRELHPLLFEKFQDKRNHWKVFPHKGFNEWYDIKLSFSPAMGLKPFAKHILNKEVSEIEIPQEYWPQDEKEYRPYNYNWPRVFDYHKEYWHSNKGVTYAKNDIIYLHEFHQYLSEQGQWPDGYDIDSDLAWMVGQVRLSGFKINNKLLEDTIEDAENSIEGIPTAPSQVENYLRAAPDWNPAYDFILTDTKETTLQAIIDMKAGAVSERAENVLKQRSLEKKIDLLKKIESVGRMHPDFNVTGTKTNRMSGRGGINYHGINREDNIREIFVMHTTRKDLPTLREDTVLSGGDFKNQEVTILDAVVNDPQLHADLKEYGSIHLLAWRLLWDDPEATLDEIKKDKDKYTRTKNGVFAGFYGAFEDKLAQTYGTSIEHVREFQHKWETRYPSFKDDRLRLEKEYCSMSQDGGIGGKVKWSNPKPYVETLFGFRRWFLLENKICKFFFDTAETLPRELNGYVLKVIRRQRPQTVSGALRSALYAAAFNFQSANLRQAGNTRIQGTGAEVTKRVQWNVWQLQPVGISDFKVKLFNVHDELMCENDCPAKVAAIVHAVVNGLKEYIPLLEIEWSEKMNSWSEK